MPGFRIMGHLRSLCRAGLVFTLSVLIWADPARAQETPADGLVPVAEVSRALTDPSATTARSVTFRGVVTFVSHVGDLCVLEGGSGVMVEPPGGTPRPAVGDEVEVTAEVKFQTADATDPSLYLKAGSVRRLGPGQLPEPLPVRMPAALNGHHHMRWVEVEGVVMQSRMENGVLFLHMTDDGGWAVINVHHWQEGDQFLKEGWGARLRIRCACVGRGHRALRVASSAQITLVKPGTAQCFGGPLEDAATLAGSDAPAARTRVGGIVLGTSEDGVHIRSGSTAFTASILAPYTSSQNQPHPLELIPPAVPAFNPGDRVELVGSAIRTKPWLELSFASFRIQGPAALPPARETEGAALLTTSVGDLVRVRGQVRSHSTSTGTGGVKETLSLDAGGVALKARLDSPEGGKLAGYREGDVLELTGLLLPPAGDDTARLLITGQPQRGQIPVAVVSRNLPPAAVRTISILAGGLVVALALAWWLRHQVRLRTAALATANANLKAEAAALEVTRAELARALDQERELGDLKSRFVNMVNHELRTPLGITMSAVELLQHYSDRIPPEQREELLGDIQRSTKSMAGLMEEVLLLGRVEAGKLGYRPAPLNVDVLAGKLTDESHSATNRRCPIEWSAENDLSGAIGDESLLRHIFHNLLSNAIKYSAEHSPVNFRARREGTEAIFTISDRGIGIPAEEIPHLFEAFHRCPNVGDIPGTGLGLVIVKRCMDLHRGTITVASKPGEGTTFTVRLPLWTETAPA